MNMQQLVDGIADYSANQLHTELLACRVRKEGGGPKIDITRFTVPSTVKYEIFKSSIRLPLNYSDYSTEEIKKLINPIINKLSCMIITSESYNNTMFFDKAYPYSVGYNAKGKKDGLQLLVQCLTDMYSADEILRIDIVVGFIQ